MYKFMTPSRFKLMIKPGYSAEYRLEGAVGGVPDRSLIRLREDCYRSTLPPFLDGLEFHFAPGRPVQSFYHLDDFFVVSNTIKEFLEAHSGCTFETKMIRTKHPDHKTTERFWAMKVTTRIDCILPEQSFASERDWSSEPPLPFRDMAMETKLSADVAPHFANKGSDTYYAYPCYGVRNVAMDFSSVQRGIDLFEPLYWPRFLVIDSDFSDELKRRCGDSSAYHFWTLGFDNVSGEYHDMLRDLR